MINQGIERIVYDFFPYGGKYWEKQVILLQRGQTSHKPIALNIDIRKIEKQVNNACICNLVIIPY
jgi:hypothetical protein